MPEWDPADLAAWSGGTWRPAPPAGRLTGVCMHTADAGPGTMFCALKGARRDGHDFVDAAFAAGADAAMVSRDVAVQAPEGASLLVVDDPRAALGRLAGGYRLTLPAVIIGITGSAGKTTVKELTAQILAAAGVTARTRGNWNNDIGLPLSMLAMPADAAYGVFEVGTNHPGEIRALCERLRPAWGVVTNVGPVHTEHFEGGVDAIAEEKADLLRALPADGTAVLDADGAHAGRLRRAAASSRILAVSLRPESDADYAAELFDPRAARLTIRERATGERCAVNLSVPGTHQALNTLMAAAVARGQGLEWAAIRGAVEAYRAPAMRWERMEVGGWHVVNDAYNANPLSMRAALEAFGAGQERGKWLVLGGMNELGERERGEHLDLGAAVARGGWAGLVTVGALGRLIAEGALRGGLPADRVRSCDDVEDAASVWRSTVPGGAHVLVKGSRSFALERIISRLGEREGDDHAKRA